MEYFETTWGDWSIRAEKISTYGWQYEAVRGHKIITGFVAGETRLDIMPRLIKILEGE